MATFLDPAVVRSSILADNWGTSQFKTADLIARVSSIAFIAHENPTNTGDGDLPPTNHWTISLEPQDSPTPTRGVWIDMVPDMPDMPGMVVLDSEGRSVPPDAIHSVRARVIAPEITVSDVLSVIIAQRRDVYVYASVGEGCRSWVQTLARDFAAWTPTIISQQDVDTVRHDVRGRLGLKNHGLECSSLGCIVVCGLLAPMRSSVRALLLYLKRGYGIIGCPRTVHATASTEWPERGASLRLYGFPSARHSTRGVRELLAEPLAETLSPFLRLLLMSNSSFPVDDTNIVFGGVSVSRLEHADDLILFLRSPAALQRNLVVLARCGPLFGSHVPRRTPRGFSGHGVYRLWQPVSGCRAIKYPPVAETTSATRRRCPHPTLALLHSADGLACLIGWSAFAVSYHVASTTMFAYTWNPAVEGTPYDHDSRPRTPKTYQSNNAVVLVASLPYHDAGNCSFDRSDMSCSRTTSTSPPALSGAYGSDDARLHRRVLNTAGRPLWMCNSELHLLEGLCDAIKAHKSLYEMGFLHGNINAGNVL
ncbi:hypothetical protein EVG20_g2964, partial [Dentipellis fragilis]